MTASNLDEIRAELQLLKPTLKKRFKVETIDIFGSYVRVEQTEEINVEFMGDDA